MSWAGEEDAFAIINSDGIKGLISVFKFKSNLIDKICRFKKL